MKEEERRSGLGRREVDEMRKQYTEWADRNWGAIQEIGHSYHSFARRMTQITLFLGFAVIILVIVQFILINDNSKRTTEIQASRLAQCSDQNKRHENTLKVLDQIYAHQKVVIQNQTESYLHRFPNDPGVRILTDILGQQITQGDKPTILLINALAPARNCKLLLQSPKKKHHQK